MCYFVFEYKSGVSGAIFTICVPAETAMNTPQLDLLI